MDYYLCLNAYIFKFILLKTKMMNHVTTIIVLIGLGR